MSLRLSKILVAHHFNYWRPLLSRFDQIHQVTRPMHNELYHRTVVKVSACGGALLEIVFLLAIT